MLLLGQDSTIAVKPSPWAKEDTERTTPANRKRKFMLSDVAKDGRYSKIFAENKPEVLILSLYVGSAETINIRGLFSNKVKRISIFRSPHPQ
jgi:hypothetical protein